MKTLTQQVDCAKRELAMRRNAYPKWVAQGKMSPDKMQHETETMEAILATLEKARMLEEVSDELKLGLTPPPAK